MNYVIADIYGISANTIDDVNKESAKIERSTIFRCVIKLMCDRIKDIIVGIKG